MKRARLFPYAVALLWATGFFFSLPLIQPYELSRLAALVFTALAALGALRTGGIPQTSGMITIALLFWANAGLSVLWSPVPLASIIAFCTFSMLPLGAIAFSNMPDGFYRLCARGAGIILGALAVLAFVQYFVLTGILVHGQVRWPFANPNSYASLLSLGFFPALGAMIAAQDRKSTILAAAFCALLLSAIAVIGGRSVLLLLLFMTALFIFLMRGPAKIRWREIATVMAAGFLSALLSLLFKSTAVPALGKMGFLLTEGVAESSISVRLDIWKAALAMIRDNLPAGTGFGTFHLYYPQYRLPEEIHSSGLMAHSDPLQFTAEMGAAAPFLFYLFLFFAAHRMLKAWRIRRDPLTLSLFCGLAAMILHAHIDFDLYAAPILALSGLMLGWWLRQTASEIAPPRPPGNLRFAAFALPVLAALFIAQGFLRSEYHADKARAAALGGDMPSFASEVEKSNSAGWGWNARAYVMAAGVPLGALESGGAAMTAEEKAALASKAEKLLQRALEKNSRSVAALHARARLALLTGDERGALGFAAQAHAMNPGLAQDGTLDALFMKEKPPPAGGL